METSKNLLLMFLFSFSSVQAKDCWVTGRCQVPILLSLHDKYTANVYRGLRVSVGFFLQYLWKRAVRIPILFKEKDCVCCGETLYIYKLRGKPYDNYRVSP